MVVTIDRQNQYEQVNKFVVTVDILDQTSYRFNFVRSCVLVLYVNCYNLFVILTLSILAYLILAWVVCSFVRSCVLACGVHAHRFSMSSVTTT